MRVTAAIIAVLSILVSSAQATTIWFPNAGFEEGFKAPWGTGQYSHGKPIWWNNGGCQSAVSMFPTLRSIISSSEEDSSAELY